MSNSVQPHRRQPTRLPRPWDSPGKNTGVGCHFLLQCMKVKSESEVAQSCLTPSDPMDCSPPGPSVHGTFQARVLEWVPSPSPSCLVKLLQSYFHIPFASKGKHRLWNINTTIPKFILPYSLLSQRRKGPFFFPSVTISISFCLLSCSFLKSCSYNACYYTYIYLCVYVTKTYI